MNLKAFLLILLLAATCFMGSVDAIKFKVVSPSVVTPVVYHAAPVYYIVPYYVRVVTPLYVQTLCPRLSEGILAWFWDLLVINFDLIWY